MHLTEKLVVENNEAGRAPQTLDLTTGRRP